MWKNSRHPPGGFRWPHKTNMVVSKTSYKNRDINMRMPVRLSNYNRSSQGPQICNIPSVKEKCKVTCNNSCVNQRKDCPYMTATLGCTNNTNVGGMAKYCRKSCGICTRPVNYKLNPMVITKCTKTCNSECASKIGSQHPLCVDQGKNCAKIAAQKGCFGLFYDK